MEEGKGKIQLIVPNFFKLVPQICLLPGGVGNYRRFEAVVFESTFRPKSKLKNLGLCPLLALHAKPNGHC